MSIPVKDGESGQERGRGRLDEYRLRRMAHLRAEATGESIEQVLSVFTGTGRYGATSDDAESADSTPDASTESPEALAPVIELGRGRRRRERRPDTES